VPVSPRWAAIRIAGRDVARSAIRARACASAKNAAAAIDRWLEGRSAKTAARPPSFRRLSFGLVKVSDRTRTGDHLDHNQELYQLSYAHRALSI
jgi:hypothetical protein